MTSIQAKILIVDDEPDFEDLIRLKFFAMIDSKEVEFFFARNGEEALRLIQSDPELNIILTDINMPVMDGFALLGNLTKLNRVYKAVVISAYGDISNIRKAMNQGASDFIMKPVNFEDFETTVRKMVAEYYILKHALIAASHLKEIQVELDIAKNIQEAMLPKDFDILPEYPKEVIGKMIPAKEVGGDFYDFFPLDNQRCGIIIADVSGKSISACLYMAVTKSLLRAFAHKTRNCAEVLTQINETLCINNNTSMFVTAFYAILDFSTGKLSYSNAGHNYPYILSSDGQLKKIGDKKSGLPLGVVIPTSDLKIPFYTETTLDLKDRDCLILYTDGVTEAMNKNEELFGVENLEKSLIENSDKSVSDLLVEVVRSVKAFEGNVLQNDDITLLGVRYLSKK